MSPSASLDFRSALQVAPERIARLKDAELGELMGQLLRAQSHRCGAPVSEVRINTEEKAADDGADATSGKPEKPDEWLGDAETCWQLKAGKAGTPAAIKGEIGKSLPSDTLTKGGRFVLVASGNTSGKKGETDRLKTLTTEAKAEGLPTDRIEVIGSERLAEWVNQHPAIAARWANRPEGLWSLQDWPALEHQAPWQASDPLVAALATYRQALDPTTVRPDEPCLHLHLHGPPGAGKTRLALEMCKQAPWADFVVYVQQARESNVLSLLAQAASEEGVRFVVVADDTPAALLKPLRDALEPSEGRIRLITLGTSHSPDPRRIRELGVETLSADSLSQLLGCWYPAMAAQLIYTVVTLAAGNPRLARLAADALNQNSSHTTATLIEQPAIRDLRAAIASHQKPKGRSDWTWPQPWDFTTYRSEKRQGFVGRQWLFEEVRAWATNPDSEQALLIGADYGVGKSAFLAELLDTGAAGLPVVAHHFCRADISDTLEAGRFVRSLAGQLADALPAYRALLEADDAKELRETLDQANQKPLPAFDQAVLAPLRRIEAPATQLLLVIDALDEALDYRPEAGGSSRNTIVDLLAKEARNLPPWLRVLATSRRRPEVVESLRQGFFSIEEINAEEARNLADIHDYVVARCEQEPLAAILSRADLSASETAEVLQAKSGGKFLYAVRVLNDLASGGLTLENRQTLDALPPGMDGFYADTFQRRFPEAGEYDALKPLLALLCAQREPMGYGQLAAILEVSIDQIGLWIEPLQDLLRFRATPPSERASESEEEWRISFDHASLEQWLTERSGGHIPRPRAGRFGVNREVAEQQIRTWALAEVEAKRAHTSPYLVRHLASHLRDNERAEVIAGQLRQFTWLKARLRVAGLNALISDFNPDNYTPYTLPPELIQLAGALRQAAHVLSSDKGWIGYEQLAPQLLARLPRDICRRTNLLLDDALKDLELTSAPRPLNPSLHAPNLHRTLQPDVSLKCPIMRTSRGRIILSLVTDKAVVWDPLNDSHVCDLASHSESITGVLELGGDEMAFVTSSHDMTIKYCHPGAAPTVHSDHRLPVHGLRQLGDNHFVSFSDRELFLWIHTNGTIAIARRISLCTAPREVVIIEQRYAIIVTLNDQCLLYDLARECLDPVSIQASVRSVYPLGIQGKCTALLICMNDLHYHLASWPLGHSLDLTRLNKLNTIDTSTIVSCLSLPCGDLLALTTKSHLMLWKNSDLNLEPLRYSFYGGRPHDFIVVHDSYIAVVDKNHRIRLLEMPEVANDDLSKPCSVVSALEFLHDGTLVALCGDGSIVAYAVHDNGPKVKDIYKTDYITQQSDLIAVKDNIFAASCSDDMVRIWAIDNNRIDLVYELEFKSSSVLTDGGMPIYLALHGGSELFAANKCSLLSWRLEISNAAHGYRLKTSDSTERLKPGKTRAVLSIHRGEFINGTAEKAILVFDDWDIYHYFSEACVDGEIRSHPSFTPQRATSQLADGRIASSASDLNIYVWKLGSSEVSLCLTGHTNTIRDILTIDNTIISCSDDSTIRKWTMDESGSKGQVFFVSDSRIAALAYNEKRGLIAAGDVDGNLQLFKM
jgi:hypothetical protein